MKAAMTAFLLLGFALGACSRPTEAVDSADPLTGTWVGDFGPAFYDRNTISLELKWDGTQLTGMVRPGDPSGRMYRNFPGFAIENATFDPRNGTFKFEAEYKPKGRRYLITGKASGNTLNGSWTWTRADESRDGDFKLKRKSS